MMTYTFINEKNSQKITKEFIDETEARHFVINHLDLSLDWQIFMVNLK